MLSMMHAPGSRTGSADPTTTEHRGTKVGLVNTGSCLAIDIGGTKIAAGVVERDGALVVRSQIPTPATFEPETLFGALLGVADEVRATSTSPINMIGIGCGGPMDSGLGTVSPLNIPSWRDFPLRDRLAEHFSLPVVLENDAKALALGEGWLGAAKGLTNFAAMVVSTGVGGGIVLDGRLLHGRLGNAGHVGHLVVEPQGRRCICGVRGCLEAEASGTAIEAITGQSASKADLAMRRRCGSLVGRAVGEMATLLDLELVAVGGSVALGFGAPFFEAANEALAERCGLSYTKGVRIVPAGLGDQAPLLGAAAVGFSREGAVS